MACSVLEYSDACVEFVPAFHSQTFTEQDTKRIRHVARVNGCTVNDLLMHQVFLAIGRLQNASGGCNQRGVVRIAMPMNMRGDPNAALACNNSSMVFLDRTQAEIDDAETLLINLRGETEKIKRRNMGLAMQRALQLAGKRHRGMLRLIPKNRCLSTAVFSNLGVVFDNVSLPRREGLIVAGDIALETIETVPACRPMTHAIFTALTYAKRLTLTLGYNDRTMSCRDSRNVFDDFASGVQQLTAECFGDLANSRPGAGVL